LLLLLLLLLPCLSFAAAVTFCCCRTSATALSQCLPDSTSSVACSSTSPTAECSSAERSYAAAAVGHCCSSAAVLPRALKAELSPAVGYTKDQAQHAATASGEAAVRQTTQAAISHACPCTKPLATCCAGLTTQEDQAQVNV
jgi:hypothetical protein